MSIGAKIKAYGLTIWKDPVWSKVIAAGILAIIALLWAKLTTSRCIHMFRNRKDPFWDEQMGNYTFKDLYNILLTETLPVETQASSIDLF